MAVVGYNDSLVQHFQHRLNLREPFRLFHLDQIFHSHGHMASLKRERDR